MSQNELCQSWLAVCPETGRKCFVKTPTPDSDIDIRTASSILLRSYTCQQKVAARRIVTATGKYSEQGTPLVRYRFLDSTVWSPLTCKRFWQNPLEILVQMSLLVDLIHLRELVHCDLKLDNFLIRGGVDSPRLILVDLDFLTSSGSSPGAKIFGSPEHIAPEILANDCVLAQTDNYSLGVALKKCLEGRDDDAVGSHDQFASKLCDLTASLTKAEPLHRPYVLIDALRQASLLDSKGLDAANRSLFSMQLLPALRDIRRSGVADADDLRKRIIEPYRILGLCEELISDLVGLYQKYPANAVRIFKSIVRKSGINRYGDFWQIAANDEQVQTAFEEIEASLERRAGETAVRRNTTDTARLLRTAGDYRDEARLTRAFLTYKRALRDLRKGEPDTQENWVLVLRQLGELARELNRLKDAAEYYRQLVDLGETRSQVELCDIHGLETVLADAGSYDEAYVLSERGLAQAKKQGDLYYQSIFNRSMAWIDGIWGNYEKAEQMIQSVLAAAAEHGWHELEIWGHYTHGIIYWRKGMFTQAERTLARGLELVKQHDLYGNALKVLSALVMVCHEVAEHDKAIHYGKLAAKYMPSTGGTNIVPFLANNMASALSRLGDIKKADYWLMKCLPSDNSEDFRRELVMFYGTDGFLRRNSGDYFAAEIAFRKALNLIDETTHPRSVAKNYHCVAELYMFRGRDDLCREYLRKAGEILAVSKDEASQAELDLIGCCNDGYNSGKDLDYTLLGDIVERLLRYNCRYFAMVGIFHLLVNADDQGRKKAISQIAPLMPLLLKSAVPLFEAVALLVDYCALEQTDRVTMMRTLKTAYRVLLNGNEKFLALVLCRRIAALYRSYASHKLARKFFDQALKLAAGIRNDRMVREIESDLGETSAAVAASSGMIESVLSISEVFKNIRNYRQSLEQVVKFAVDQTGAERGVLLLKSDQTSELQVAAFVNCDEDSLTDIRDFSSTIPLEVARNIDPLVIENALADKRTKNYKSIVIHNILSVICIPISIDSRVLGVLYLDHHTIPALFGKDDVTYVSSIANLMAVMIETIRSYRDITIINRQLVEDVSRVGNRQRFITRDESMLELFGKLPEIARTNAPVLIVGESGTGKEILCEMIHRLSLRTEKPLVKLNCAAIAGTLIESELFGVAANVATDVKEREGKFSAADGGTLLLDEIGDMPLEVQAKVLRAVEYQQFEKVGSNKSLHTDIRFIYATNKDLAALVKRAEFRQDLLYRINTITIEIPPLRERRADIPLLIAHFVSVFAAEKSGPRFSTEVMEALIAYDWPGNVRELKNLVERCCILYPRNKVELQHLPNEFRASLRDHVTVKEAAALSEKENIRRILIKHNWNQSRASAEISIPLSTLRRKIKKYKISRNV